MAHKTSAEDSKEHYGVIIVGTGVSGLAAACQLKRQLNYDDVMMYEKSDDIGGTWHANQYPGAACDIPVSLYSFSFAPSAKFHSEWAGQAALMDYLHEVQDRFKIYNIVYQTKVSNATFSSKTGLWTVQLVDLTTKETRTRTCNILIAACGPLSVPKEPPFSIEKFDGDVWHTAQWRSDVSLENKRVVLLGNGCTAAQIIPSILNTNNDHERVRTLTQIARGRQSVLPPPGIPSGSWIRWAFRWIPGLLYAFRAALFLGLEGNFVRADTEKGRKGRAETMEVCRKYVRETAPEKYWDALEPDFDIGAKRRIYDNMGFLKSMHDERFELIQDDVIESATGSTVRTKKGREVEADVLILSTGFQAQQFLFPLQVVNGNGESLSSRFKQSGASTYLGTMVNSFPNFFICMGPNTVTGHSSVIFTAECQIDMILRLIKPILALTRRVELLATPAPTVEVTREAEERVYTELRAEMKKKVWESQKEGGVSWYVDERGLCTTLQAFSQIDFWRRTRFASSSDFKWTGC